MVAALKVGLSSITHILQYVIEQPQKQKWDSVGFLEIFPMNLLLKVEENDHNQVMWPEIEALRYPE